MGDTTETFDTGQLVVLGIAALVILGLVALMLAWRRRQRAAAEDIFADEEHRKESDEHLNH